MAASPPIHLRPVAPVAPRVVLPGDPGRALALAQVLLGDDRLMANHQRGLWGYTGTAQDGAALTIQSTGIGGPSAAVVLEELAGLGVTRAVRVGTCTALPGGPPPGALVVPGAVVGEDGTSRALGASGRRELDPGLVAALARDGATPGLVVCTDLFYEPDGGGPRWSSAGATVHDLQSAALAAVAARHGMRFAAVLVVATGLDATALADASTAAGRLAAAALSA